jgi:hypothetical protein
MTGCSKKAHAQSTAQLSSASAVSKDAQSEPESETGTPTLLFVNPATIQVVLVFTVDQSSTSIIVSLMTTLAIGTVSFEIKHIRRGLLSAVVVRMSRQYCCRAQRVQMTAFGQNLHR